MQSHMYPHPARDHDQYPVPRHALTSPHPTNPARPCKHTETPAVDAHPSPHDGWGLGRPFLHKTGGRCPQFVTKAGPLPAAPSPRGCRQ